MLEAGFYNMDCFDGLRDIEDKSIDLILTDPPYNIGIAEWDKIPDYVNWCGKWIKECERVLKNTGSFYFWHSDMNQLSQLLEWIRNNTAFVFNSFIIWDKGNFRSLSWKNPSKDSDLRSWFNTCEYCACFTLQDDYGLNNFLMQRGLLRPIQDYLINEKKKSGLSINEYRILLNQSTVHYFSINEGHWRMPSEENYLLLQKTGCFKKDYCELKREYENLREKFSGLRYTHNLEKNHNNLWRCNMEHKIHICEKPTELLQKIIRCSTNINGVVLDLFAGSASTAIAAHRTGRKYICFEKDADYFKAASERLAREKATTPLFAPQEIYKQEGLTFDT